MKVTTDSGFEVEVRAEAVKDFRFLRAVRDMSGKDPVKQIAGMIDLSELIMSQEDVERLLEHVMDENGNAPADDVAREIDQILRRISAQDNRVKNS